MTGTDKASPKISPLVPPLETARVPTEPFLPTAPVRPMDAISNEMELMIRNKDGSRYIHPLTKTTVTVGRRPDNDIVLPDRCVSGHHAEFQRMRSGEYELVDHGSYNGTTVNGHRIDRVKLKAGDVVEFGSFKVEIVSAQQPVRAGRPSDQPDEEVKRLQAERDKLIRERDSYVSIVAQLKSDQCRAEKAAEAVRADLHHDQQELARVRKELEEHRALVERARNSNVSQQVQELDAQVRSRQEKLAEVENALARARENEKRLASVTADLAKKEQEYKSFVLQLSNLRAERDRLLDEVQRMRSSTAAVPKAHRMEETGHFSDAGMVKQREILLAIEEDTRKAREELNFTKQNLEAFQFRRDELRDEVQRQEAMLRKLSEQVHHVQRDREHVAADPDDSSYRPDSFFLPPVVPNKANGQAAAPAQSNGHAHAQPGNGAPNGYPRPVAVNPAHHAHIEAPMASPVRPKLEPRIAV